MSTPTNVRLLILATLAGSLFWLATFPLAVAQSSSSGPQSLVFAGLRSIASQGTFRAVTSDASGNLFLLFDQSDGIRLLKASNDGTQLLAQAHLGAAGDAGATLSIDPLGNVYITGTTSSGVIAPTAGAAITIIPAGSVSSFVAKFDTSLNQIFLTFTGGTRIEATALAASPDAVFVAGTTYASDLPVTSSAIQKSFAPGSMQNGFVERFSSDGSNLVYASYLTGALGDTAPAGIAVDAVDDAWIVGSTTASGFPTVAALVPVMLSAPSGFLLRLAPTGDSIVFSTFVPGSGLSSVALDSTGQMLLVSGNIALGQFPVDTVIAPLVPTAYQILLRMPLDGSAVAGGTLIAPGLESTVVAAANGAAWIAGDFTAGAPPLLPLPALSSIGNAYAVRVTPADGIDQTLRFGGLANQQQTYASAPVVINALAVDPDGELLVAGTAQPTASAGLLSTETYDLPLRDGRTEVLPSTLRNAVANPAVCHGSLCAGSAGFLAKVALGAAPALTFSVDDVPFVTLRNLGSLPAQNLQLHASAGSLVTNCPSTLAPGGECGALLSSGTAGTITASATGVPDSSLAYGAYPSATQQSTLIFYPKELDFGIQTAGSLPSTRTITITNLGIVAETFDSGAAGISSLFAEQSSDCTSTSLGSKTLPAGSTCHVTIGFNAPADALKDGFVQAEWMIGARQLFLTGYSQAASLSVSASEIDFGTQIQPGLRLPRFLYLSNSSSSSITHAAVNLPSSSPFTIADGCPDVLPAQAVCRIRIDYLASTAPSTDSATLTLDHGLQVLVTGQTQPSSAGTGPAPDLSVSPQTAVFGNAVTVTQVSDVVQTVAITNNGASTYPITRALTGDFLDVSTCGATLTPASTCTVTIRFAPSQPGPRQGLLTITTSPTALPVQVALSGDGIGLLPPNDGTLSFPGVPVGQPLVQFYKVAPALQGLSVATSGPFRVTIVEDNGFGHGTPPAFDYVTNGSGTCLDCWVAVRFQPTAVGPQKGTITFSSSPNGSPYVLSLDGSGLATTGIITSPSVQDFGGIPVQSSSGAILISVTNASLPPSQISLSPPIVTGDFAIVPAPNSGTTCTGILAYGATCFVGLSFNPTLPGPRTGALALSTSAGMATVLLGGTGTPDPGIAISPLTLAFGLANAAVPQIVTVTNTGLSAIQVTTPTITSSNFSLATTCATILPGTSCPIDVAFLPGPTTVTGTLVIPILSGGHTSNYPVSLEGAATQTSVGLSVAPAPNTYGPVATLTAGPTRQYTVKNLTSSNLALTATYPHSYVLAGTPCATIAASSSCDFQLQFVPLTNSDIAGSVLLQGTPEDGGPPISAVAYAEGYGVGTGTLTFSGGLIVQGVFNFGSVAVRQSSTEIFTISNAIAPGTPPITVRRITSAPPFLSQTTCGSPLAVGRSCTVSVTYTPTGQPSAVGAKDAGILSVESDAQSSPDTIDLQGQFTGSPVAGSAPVLATFMLSQESLTFPPVSIAEVSPPQTILLTNNGTTLIQVSSLTAPADFSIQSQCSAVSPGSTCSISVQSTPQSSGSHLAALEISSNASDSLEFVSLVSVGLPAPLSTAPGALSFGPVLVGSTATLPVQVTSSNTVPFTFNQISASGDYTAAGTCPPAGGSLGPNSSCTVQVTFAPVATGLRLGALSLNTSASAPAATVALTGTGIQSMLLVTPTSLAFGSIAVGASATLSLALANQGTAAITGLSAAVTAKYAITAPCPATLAPSASCTLQVAFTPTAPGPANGSLTLASSDPSSPTTIPLTGDGVQSADFAFTVEGGSSASMVVTSGQSASFNLLLTPLGLFNGTVVLSCAATQSTPDASCSLLPAAVTLNGAPVGGIATISTISPAYGTSDALPGNLNRSYPVPLAVLTPVLCLAFYRRARLRTLICKTSALLTLSILTSLGGCGGGTFSRVRSTPPGTYQFTVTATSTNAVLITHTVALTLVVNSR